MSANKNTAPPYKPFDVLLRAPDGHARAVELFKIHEANCVRYEDSFKRALYLLSITTGALLLLLAAGPPDEFTFLDIRFSRAASGVLIALLICLLEASHYYAVSQWIMLNDSGTFYELLIKKLYPEVTDHFALASLHPTSIMKPERLINRRLSSSNWFGATNSVLALLAIAILLLPYGVTGAAAWTVYQSKSYSFIVGALVVAAVLMAAHTLALSLAFFRLDAWEQSYRKDSLQLFSETVNKMIRALEERLDSIVSAPDPDAAAAEAVDWIRAVASEAHAMSIEGEIPIDSHRASTVMAWCVRPATIDWRIRFRRAITTVPIPMP